MNGWIVNTDDGELRHIMCPHRFMRTGPYLMDWNTNWYACGHPAACGAPCSSWSCPIVIGEIHVRDVSTVDPGE